MPPVDFLPFERREKCRSAEERVFHMKAEWEAVPREKSAN